MWPAELVCDALAAVDIGAVAVHFHCRIHQCLCNLLIANSSLLLVLCLSAPSSLSSIFDQESVVGVYF